MFEDVDMPCTYICDYRPVSEKIPRALTTDEQEFIKRKPIWPTIKSVEASCPAMYDHGKANHSSFDLTTLTFSAGTHVIMFGHSYLWESFQAIRFANKKLGTVTKEKTICGVDSDCVGAGGCICAGGTDLKGSPYCGGTSNFNCDCNKGYRYYYSNGATLTGIFNWETMQRQQNSAKLSTQLAAGVDGTPYTHALVMEPHTDIFFTNPIAGDTMETSATYGCGWSTQFWGLWKTATPTTKVFHVPSWGYSSANLQIVAASPQVITPNTQGNNCTAESQWNAFETKASDFAGGEIQGHHCIAARDSYGYSLGVIPSMAAGLITKMYA